MGPKIKPWYTEKISQDCRVQDLNSKSAPQSQDALLSQKETIVCLKYAPDFNSKIK